MTAHDDRRRAGGVCWRTVPGDLNLMVDAVLSSDGCSTARAAPSPLPHGRRRPRAALGGLRPRVERACTWPPKNGWGPLPDGYRLNSAGWVSADDREYAAQRSCRAARRLHATAAARSPRWRRICHEARGRRAWPERSPTRRRPSPGCAPRPCATRRTRRGAGRRSTAAPTARPRPSWRAARRCRTRSRWPGRRRTRRPARSSRGRPACDTGTPRMSACSCMHSRFAVMPPSTLRQVSVTPESAAMASTTSRDW